MKRSVYFVMIVVMVFCVSRSYAADSPMTEEQKTLYAIGLKIAQQLTVFSLAPAELEIVKQAISDAGAGKKPAVELEAYMAKIQELARTRRKIQGEKLAVVNKEFLEKAAKEHGAIKTNSGLIFVSLKEGNGISPKVSDTVKVNYRGTLSDGKEFDSTYKRGTPLDLKLDRVIKCWAEGLQKMKPGGKAKIYCPSSIAYGDTGVGDLILPGAALAFDIELIEIKHEAKPESKPKSGATSTSEQKLHSNPDAKHEVTPGNGEKK